MPSLAQGYGQGLLSGLEMQERQRRLKEGELTDEFLRERIEDMRFQRKTLMSQLKEEEAEKKRQVEEKEIQTGVAHLGMQPGGSYTVGKLLEEAPETVRKPLHSALDLVPGLTSGQQLQRTRVEEKVEGAPGVRPWGVSEIEESKIPQAARMALGFEPKAKAEKAPEELVGRTERWTKSQEAHEKELRKYEHEFGKAWREAKIKKNAINAKGEAITDKREFWNLWQEGLPSDLRLELKLRLGLMQPTGTIKEETTEVTGDIEDKEVGNKTEGVADNLSTRIENGEFDREYIQDYIDENAEEYRAQGVDPDLLKQIMGF